MIPPPCGEGRSIGGLQAAVLQTTPMLRIGYGEAEAGVGVAPSTASVVATPTRPAFGWPPSPPRVCVPQTLGGGIRKSSRGARHADAQKYLEGFSRGAGPARSRLGSEAWRDPRPARRERRRQIYPD